MSSAGPWSVKGIDARAREIAKEQARLANQTLGEWLNARIIEDATAATRGRAPAESTAGLQGLSRALDALSSRMESAERRSADAVSAVDRKLAGVLNRLDGAEADSKLEEVRAAQAELAARLGRAAPEDHPRREALRALEQALGKVAAQIYEGESRSRAQAAEIRGDLAELSTRVEAIDARAAPTAGAAAEDVERRFADMAARLEAAEQRTAEAMRALEGSFAGLDRRVADVEGRPQGGVSEQRFEQLAAELHDRVETARADMAERIRAAAGGGLERLEQALRELAGDVARAEKRQVGAIDSMGREVVRIAQSLNGRVGAMETRQAEGEQRVGAEVARMADIVEHRLKDGDEQQAQALERLGGEIARIAETLAERIGASERRSAQTAEDAFEHLRDVSERLNARHEATAAEVDARIRSTEERAARLLETPAPASVVHPADVLAAVSASPAPVAAAWEPPAPPGSPFVSAEQATTARAEAAAPADTRPVPPPYDPFAGFEPEPQPLADSFPPPEAQATEELPPPPADPFSAITRAEAPVDRLSAMDPADDIFDAPPPSAPARASTRELIEQARAAARDAAEARGGRKGKLQELGDSSAGQGGLPSLPWMKKRDGSGAARTAVVASLVASSTVALAVGAASLAHTDHTPATTGEAPTAAAGAPAATDGQLAVALDTPAPASPAGLQETTAPPVLASDAAASPSMARRIAAAARANTSTDGAAPQAEEPGAAAKLAFGDALRRIEAGDASGVTALKRAANLGYAPAQLKLASLYEQGASGLPKDVSQARVWTQRAAVNGDPHAQFNLGMFFANGDGGLKNDSSAAAWFRRAADGGLHDAQFNLAVMSQTGRGVPKNLPEAYKWYLVAASQGDAGARQAADALKADLSPDQQSIAERAAAAFRTEVATAQVKAVAAN
ncbi:MAG: SEL1-like repeat protein [Caulobacteraceae bacterium]|nr:SEL1-like repeat protein [Caulobacter sp.]